MYLHKHLYVKKLLKILNNKLQSKKIFVKNGSICMKVLKSLFREEILTSFVQQEHPMLDINLEGTTLKKKVHLEESFVPFLECHVFVACLYILFCFHLFSVYKVIFGLQVLFSPISFSNAHLKYCFLGGSQDLSHYKLRCRYSYYLHFPD